MADEILISMIKSLALDSGTVSSVAEPGTAVLADGTKKWRANEHRDCIVRIISGRGTGQRALIRGNNATSLQVFPVWSIGLDTMSVYVICRPEINSEIVAILDLLRDSGFSLNALKVLLYAIEGKLDTVDTVADDIKTQTDKLAGVSPVSGSTTANWDTATGTSGEAGADLVTIGANDTKYKVLSLVLDISALTVGSVVTVKMFQQVNGVEKKVYSEGFVRQAQVQGSEPDGLWVIAGVVGIHEALRVEVYSSTNESAAIGYDYMLEAM